MGASPIVAQPIECPRRSIQRSLKRIAMTVALKPEMASVDASAETLISADKKYAEVYEKQSGAWKPKIIIWRLFTRFSLNP